MGLTVYQNVRTNEDCFILRQITQDTDNKGDPLGNTTQIL